MTRYEYLEGLLGRDRRARGRVLDAGTGNGVATALLAGLGPRELVSVSLDDASFDEARRRLPVVAEGQVRFALGDLAAPDGVDFLEQDSFDLVVGDYLLAASAGHRPFREQALLANLLGLLAPGGMLVLTGMEPFEPCRTPEEEVVRAVLRWWDALTYLSGEEIYREAPAGWVVERLREAAGGRAGEAAPAGPAAAEPRFEVAEPVWTDPLDWSLAKLGRAVEEAVGRAEASADRALAAFARRRLAELLRGAGRLPAFRTGDRRVAWSRDWIVRAERL